MQSNCTIPRVGFARGDTEILLGSVNARFKLFVVPIAAAALRLRVVLAEARTTNPPVAFFYGKSVPLVAARPVHGTATGLVC
jgi:hypothetical protein